MPCCSSQRTSLGHDSSPAMAAGRLRLSPVEFEYLGQGQIDVTGPQTGAVYRFSARTSRVRVHGSDAPSLVYVPGLKPVR